MPKCGMHEANTQVAVSGRSVYEIVVSPPAPRARSRLAAAGSDAWLVGTARYVRPSRRPWSLV